MIFTHSRKRLLQSAQEWVETESYGHIVRDDLESLLWKASTNLLLSRARARLNDRKKVVLNLWESGDEPPRIYREFRTVSRERTKCKSFLSRSRPRALCAVVRPTDRSPSPIRRRASSRRATTTAPSPAGTCAERRASTVTYIHTLRAASPLRLFKPESSSGEKNRFGAPGQNFQSVFQVRVHRPGGVKVHTSPLRCHIRSTLKIPKRILTRVFPSYFAQVASDKFALPAHAAPILLRDLRRASIYISRTYSSLSRRRRREAPPFFWRRFRARSRRLE